jgi:hypothetical protein
MAPLQIIPSIEFDDTKHTIDVVAQEYLKQASKSVQHLIPIKTFADRNCLFNSIVSLMPDFDVSAVELRGLLHFLCIYRKMSRMNLINFTTSF